jgi:hypothetical protein
MPTFTRMYETEPYLPYSIIFWRVALWKVSVEVSPWVQHKAPRPVGNALLLAGFLLQHCNTVFLTECQTITNPHSLEKSTRQNAAGCTKPHSDSGLSSLCKLSRMRISVLQPPHRYHRCHMFPLVSHCFILFPVDLQQKSPICPAFLNPTPQPQLHGRAAPWCSARSRCPQRRRADATMAAEPMSKASLRCCTAQGCQAPVMMGGGDHHQ